MSYDPDFILLSSTRYIFPRQERVTIKLNKDMIDHIRLHNGWSGPMEFAFEDTDYQGMIMWMRNPPSQPDYALIAEEAERKGIEIGERNLQEQIDWTVARCNEAMGDGFSGTPNSSVAAVCDALIDSRGKIKKLRQQLREYGQEHMKWQRMTGVKDPAW